MLHAYCGFLQVQLISIEDFYYYLLYTFSHHTLINLSHHIQIKLNSKAEISKGHLQLLLNLCPVLLQILKRACTCRAMAVIQTV